MNLRVAAIIAAAGSGDRLGERTPKALVDLDGRTLIEHAVALFAPVAEQIIICVPASRVESLTSQFASNRRISVVAGGDTRSLSVRNAISILARDIDCVLVHDAARALMPQPVIDRLLAEIQRGAEAVIPILPVPDTIKEVLGDKVVRTVDRTALQRVQTPQAFKTVTLVDAHAAAKRDGVEGTDDASLVERTGIKVATVAGDERGFKITTPFDLEVARAIVRGI